MFTKTGIPNLLLCTNNKFCPNIYQTTVGPLRCLSRAQITVIIQHKKGFIVGQIGMLVKPSSSNFLLCYICLSPSMNVPNDFVRDIGAVYDDTIHHPGLVRFRGDLRTGVG